MNQIKYVQNAYSKSGTAFIDTTLEEILKYCLTLPKHGKKGNYGSIFIYNSNILGEHLECEVSTGLILLDIDYIDKATAETIYNRFDELADRWYSLLAIQFSSSYYINPDVKSGLHIYVKSNNLNKDDYHKQAQICLAIFAELVYQCLNIDLKAMNKVNAPVLDMHNTNLYQRFNLFYSTFKYNECAETFNLDMVGFDLLEKLELKYNLELDKEITKTISPTLNNVGVGTNLCKTKIDRNLHIGSYSGNDIRFRISIIADKLFGDNAKSFCDKFFYYENNKSIYTHYPSGNTINPLIYKWLVKNGYIIESTQNFIKNWLEEYSNEIVNEIKANKYLEIVAPTGTGKTTYINNYLAKKFNSVVIVPFNVTNKLYNNLFEINASYVGDVPQKKPVVMVWDQAIRRWNEIKDRHIIIDEAHTLFFDRNYRDSAIKLMMKLLEDNCHTTFITATPAGESELFKMKQIHYFKNRATIQLNIKATKNIEWSQYNYIKKCLDNNWYDKIVLLDDLSAKKIYEEFVVNCYGDKISYIRSSTKDSKDFISLRENELLSKKLTICTCVAFNGLNFKNENEKILVVGSIQQGITTSCEIIQQIGRIRNSKVTGLYFYNPDKFYDEDINAKEMKAQECNDIVLKGCSDTFLSYDRKYLDNDYVSAMRNIQQYQIKHSSIDVIISELGATGYIKGKVEDRNKQDELLKKMTLAMKREESDEMKNDIINNIFLTKEYEKEYQHKWAKEIRYLISNPHYSGITIDMFIEMFNKGTKHKLVETSINNIKEIVRYVGVDELEFKNSVDNMKLYASMLSNPIDRKKFISNMKRVIEIRKKYADKIKFNNDILDFTDIVFDVIQFEYESQMKEIECGRLGGKKGKQIEINGVTYNTVKEAAEKLNVSRPTIYKMMR